MGSNDDDNNFSSISQHESIESESDTLDHLDDTGAHTATHNARDESPTSAINEYVYDGNRHITMKGDPELLQELHETIVNVFPTGSTTSQGDAVLNIIGGLVDERPGNLQIRSSLEIDAQTLSNVLRRGSFTDNSARFINDGYSQIAQSSKTVNVAVIGTGRSRAASIKSVRGSISMATRRLSIERAGIPETELFDEGVAFGTKEELPAVTLTIATAATDKETILEVQLEKPKHVLEDEIARNLEELVREKKEYNIDQESNKILGPKPQTKRLIGKTMFGLSASLINSVVGAGILALSETANKMGIVMYVVWMVLTAIFYVVTWKYLNEAIHITGAATFRELLYLIFGKVFATIVDVCNVIFFISFLMGYQIIATQYILVIVGDFITDREKFDFTMDMCYGNPQRIAGVACRWHFIVIALVAVVLNFSLIMFKKVDFLNKISIIALIAAILTTFIVLGKTVYNGTHGLSSNGDTVKNFVTAKGKLWPDSLLGFFTMAPFLTSTFQIHACFAPLYSGTFNISKRSKISAMHKASYMAIFICAILYGIIGVSGTMSFDKVSSNILNDFSNENVKTVDGLIIFCRILMSLVVVVSYPALMFPTSASVLRWIPHDCKFMRHNHGNTALYVVRVSLLLLTTVLSMFITNIGSVFSIASAIFSIFVVYISPFCIMMIWPKIKAFGDPSRRKISLIDQLMFNKKVDGNKFFDENDIINAMTPKDQEIVSLEAKNLNNNRNHIEETEEAVVNELENTESTLSKPLETTKEREGETQIENCKTEEEANSLKKKRTSKLPDVPISKGRIAIFSIAIILSVVYCILSVVGSVVQQ